jgi:class 3 adenylate cyclase
LGEPQKVRAVVSLSLEELASQAEVDVEYVRQLAALGAFHPRAASDRYDAADVRRVHFLRMWEAAGYKGVADLVRAGELAVSWFDAPTMTRSAHLDVTYAGLCRTEGLAIGLGLAIQEALGFPRPEPDEHARGGDPDLYALVATFLSVGVSEAAILGMVRVYADALRRVALAEAELYESAVEEPLRRSGMSERDVLERGAPFADEVVVRLERAVLDVYRRQREHVWLEHCIAHAEVALERAGVRRTVATPPTICFVDLTGYTRLTEERGDEAAAHVAAHLSALVGTIARRHGGRPIRWLGDGGMFLFRDPGVAVSAGLEMVEAAPRAGLPPMHIGLHTGPVVFQEGDVYGRTVNLASRIASHAGAGEVLATDETAVRTREANVRFEPLAPVTFHGMDVPVTLHRAVRDVEIATERRPRTS